MKIFFKLMNAWILTDSQYCALWFDHDTSRDEVHSPVGCVAIVIKSPGFESYIELEDLRYIKLNDEIIWVQTDV